MLFEKLDTFIAFAVVMLLLSMLVMAFVQLLVAVLGLRGRNLRWGVERLLKEAAPEAFKDGSGLDAGDVAYRVLTQPALGPSRNWVAMMLRWVLEKSKVLAALGEWSAGKGRTRRAVRRVLGALGKVWRPATTIRPEELVKLLDAVGRDLGAAGVGNAELTAAMTTGADAFVTEGKKLAAQLAQQFPAQADQAKALGEQIEAMGKTGGRLAQRVDEWFETVMDATSERFKLWTRWLTAAGAVVLAFGFQVDSLSMFKQLSGDPAVREELVRQAAGAQGLFEDLAKVATEEREVPSPPRAAGAGGGGQDVAPAAGQGGATGGEGEGAPGAAGTTDGASDAAAQRVEAARKGLEQARELVEATGLDLLEPLYPTWGDFWTGFRGLLPFSKPAEVPSETLAAKLREGLSGKLMTVLLLSLGAPFWYSALSKLASLRSVVAEKADKEGETA
jgi:hypothetical protein